MKIDKWAEIISSVKTPMSLLALITLIIGYLLSVNSDSIVQWSLIVLFFLITVSCLVYVMKNKQLFPSEIQSIWSKNDLPLTKESADAWLGKWNAHWTYTAKDNSQKPYLDDIVEIKEIDFKTGELTASSASTYVENEEYILKGRVSNKRIAHIFYTSPAKAAGLSGMVILSRPPLGDIKGWWLGAGRKGGDIGGGVTMQRHEENKDFALKTYEINE